MIQSPTEHAALYVGRPGHPGDAPMARQPSAPAEGTAGGPAAPFPSAAPPRLPVLREVVRRWPVPETRLVLAGELGAGTVEYLRVLSGALDVAAVVTGRWAGAAARWEGLGDTPVLVPDRPEDLGRTAAEYAGRVSRRTPAGVVLQAPSGLWDAADEALLDGPAVRGLVKSAEWKETAPPGAASPPRLPVFTTVGSPLEPLLQEPAGQALAQGLEAALRQGLSRSAGDANVGVLAFGTGDAAVATALRGLGARIGVHDADPIRRCAAVLAGHRAMDRQELLQWADVLVDPHGELLRDADALALLRDGAVVLTDGSPAGPSAPDRLAAGLAVVEQQDGIAVCRFKDNGLYVVAGAAPRHVDEQIVGRLHDLLCCEMYLCIRELATRRYRPGAHRLSVEQCEEIAWMWCRTYGRSQ
ncbi:hypothetical protein LE181_01305 [Streptomyces sp. SCA3-4]|uniref:hypothetical protein n=1 Tax=Streptomyces sichuanensis TaxID=2871810 RepID=UPI001CE329F8|nr:hypothetical protein [Streptomyces sichuanensis]MCA6090820.1 hypothetical protein [Streptomyces sichuanensis]